MSIVKTVLRQPGVARLLAAQFLIVGQVFLSITILPVFTVHLGGDALTAALHAGIFTGGGVLLRFYFGPLADRRGRLLPIMIGAFCFASANLLFLAADNLLFLAAARFYQAIGLAAYLSAAAALLIDLVPESLRGSALSLGRSVGALGLLVFPAGAERIVAIWGFEPMFAAAALTGGLGMWLIAGVPGRARRHARPQATTARLPVISQYRDEPATFGKVLRVPTVPLILTALGMTAVTHIGSMTFLPLRTDLPPGAGMAPYFLTMGITAMLIGGFGGVLDRFGPQAIAIAALIASGAGMALLVITPLSPPVMIAAGALLGIAYNFGFSACNTWLAATVPSRLRATALAVAESSIDGSITLLIPLLGVLAASSGEPYAFAVGAALSIGVAALLALTTGRISRRQIIM